MPVRVRNSSDAVLIYRLELAATSADGRSVQAAVAPQFPALAPGATATMDVLLEPASPDAVAVLTGASRFVPPPGT